MISKLVNQRIDAWETLTPDDAEGGDFITLADGTRLHYLQTGNRGDALLLIHGFMGSSEEWFRNIDVLAQTYRVWAIDLIGFGYSSRVTARTYSLKYFARAVREFMELQDIPRATMIGHSMGGAIALELAHDYPAIVNKLILIAPASYLAQIPTAINLAARMPLVPRALIGLTMTSERARMAAWRNAFGNTNRLVMQDAASRARTARVKGTADAMVAMIASPSASDLPTGLERIAAPTLIISGDKDRAVPHWLCKRLARKLPNARLVALEGAGHLPHVECPEIVNRWMLDFMNEQS